MEGFNTYEYSASQKSEGLWLLYKILLIVGYVLFVTLYFVIIYVTKLFPVGALIPVFLWMLIYFTWKYANPDYTYEIRGGVFNYYVKYGKKKSLKASFKISEAKYIGPIKDYKEKLPGTVYSALPSEKAADIYILVYNTPTPCAIKFIATKDALRLIRRHNNNTVITETSF
jgi:hypothetical protein